MVQFWVCENIPFNKNYKDVVSFDTQDLQQSYFKDLSRYTDISNRFRITGTDISFRLAQNYDNSNKINYMVILQDGKHYYFFIDSVQYVDANTTQLNGTMDIWQTYLFEHEIRDAFISRQHEDRFKRSGDKLIPIYNLEKENIELGEDYITKTNKYFTDPNVTYQDLSGSTHVYWLIIISSEPLKQNNPNTYKGVMRKYENLKVGYYTYTIPVTLFDSGLTFKYIDGRLSGQHSEYPLATIDDIEQLMKLPQVNSIYVSKYSPISVYIDGTDFNRYVYSPDIKKDSDDLEFIKGNGLMIPISGFTITNQYDIREFIPNYKYNDLLIIDRDINLEPKLKTKPYTLYTFTNNLDTPIDFGVNELRDFISYIETHGYDYKDTISINNNDNGTFYSRDNVKNNELPLVNDKYLQYMANNKASATTGIAIAGAQVVGGTALTLMTSGMGSYIGLSQSMQGSQKIISELMKQSDLRNAPLSVREIGNNVVHTFRSTWGKGLGLKLFVRQVREQFFNRAYEYFYRYGYKVNKFGVPNIRSRYYFNHIVCSEVTVTGNINQSILTELENIYKNGTTIWHKRGNEDLKIYDYTKENVEVSLI